MVTPMRTRTYISYSTYTGITKFKPARIVEASSQGRLKVSFLNLGYWFKNNKIRHCYFDEQFPNKPFEASVTFIQPQFSSSTVARCSEHD